MAKSVYLISEAAKEVCVENHVLRYWEEELALPVKRNSQGHRYYTTEDLNTFKRIKYLKEQGLQLKAIKLFLSKDGKLITYRPKEEPMENSVHTEPLEEKSKAETSAKASGGQINHPLRQNSDNRQENVSLMLHQGDKVTAFCKETSQRSPAEQAALKPEISGQDKGGELIKDGSQMRQEERNEKAQKLQMILKLMIEEVLREYDSDLKDGLKEEMSEKLCTDVRDAVIKEMDYQFRMQEEREEKRGQEREERDQELLQRIEEILKAKKNMKPGKTDKLEQKPEKTEKFGKIEKQEKKKPGIFQWKAKNVQS